MATHAASTCDLEGGCSGRGYCLAGKCQCAKCWEGPRCANLTAKVEGCEHAASEPAGPSTPVPGNQEGIGAPASDDDGCSCDVNVPVQNRLADLMIFGGFLAWGLRRRLRR